MLKKHASASAVYVVLEGTMAGTFKCMELLAAHPPIEPEATPTPSPSATANPTHAPNPQAKGFSPSILKNNSQPKGRGPKDAFSALTGDHPFLFGLHDEAQAMSMMSLSSDVDTNLGMSSVSMLGFGTANPSLHGGFMPSVAEEYGLSLPLSSAPRSVRQTQPALKLPKRLYREKIPVASEQLCFIEDKQECGTNNPSGTSRPVLLFPFVQRLYGGSQLRISPSLAGLRKILDKGSRAAAEGPGVAGGLGGGGAAIAVPGLGLGLGVVEGRRRRRLSEDGDEDEDEEDSDDEDEEDEEDGEEGMMFVDTPGEADPTPEHDQAHPTPTHSAPAVRVGVSTHSAPAARPVHISLSATTKCELALAVQVLTLVLAGTPLAEVMANLPAKKDVKALVDAERAEAAKELAASGPGGTMLLGGGGGEAGSPGDLGKSRSRGSRGGRENRTTDKRDRGADVSTADRIALVQMRGGADGGPPLTPNPTPNPAQNPFQNPNPNSNREDGKPKRTRGGRGRNKEGGGGGGGGVKPPAV